MGPFIVDFCCPRLRLIVELDGGIHDEQAEQDEERTQLLASSGYTVVRFRNEVVFSSRSVVLEQIVQLTEELKKRRDI